MSAVAEDKTARRPRVGKIETASPSPRLGRRSNYLSNPRAALRTDAAGVAGEVIIASDAAASPRADLVTNRIHDSKGHE